MNRIARVSLRNSRNRKLVPLPILTDKVPPEYDQVNEEKRIAAHVCRKGNEVTRSVP